MSFPSCPSPPPPMPSPVLVPVPLPSPPPFTKKPSRSRLARTLRSPRFSDGPLEPDSRRPRLPSPPVSSLRTPRQRAHPSRCRSPPPSPAIRSPPPPVPPIPAFVLATNNAFGPSHKPSMTNRVPVLDLYIDCPREDPAGMRCEAQASGALTCMQFLAVHNQTGQCGA